MIIVALAALAAALIVLFLGRFERDRALRRWDFVVSGRAANAAATLRDRLAEDTDVATHTFDLALKRRSTLSYDEAVRLLTIAADTIEQAAQDRHRRLRALAVYSRMAEAIVPVPAIRPSSFRLLEMRSLTLIARWLHELLSSYQERFRFRLAVIGLGIRLIVRSVRGSRSRAAVMPAQPEPFETFGDSLHDFKTLDEEQVASFHDLLRSAAATDRDTLPAEIRGRSDSPDQ